MPIDRDQDDQQLVFVIRATNIVETKMKNIIAAYVGPSPDRADFVASHLLNNSIVSFAAKVKLVLAIAEAVSVKVKRNALHTLLSRRNAFAHQDHLTALRFTTDDEGIPDISVVVESIKASGELESVTHEKAMYEFTCAYGEVETDLAALARAVGVREA